MKLERVLIVLLLLVPWPALAAGSEMPNVKAPAIYGDDVHE
jgi:hypothetical protein